MSFLLSEFQKVAVDRICDRLLNGRSKRFLLADEVGLGKTMVARGVIDKLAALHPRRGFTVVYICSNAEIGEQNRTKLSPDPERNQRVGRLTLLPLRSREMDRQGGLHLFSFTPGTSLQFGRATGVAEERQLLLYLLRRVWGARINRKRWRVFFQCGVELERWLDRTRYSDLKYKFTGSISLEFQERLKKEWDKVKVPVLREDDDGVAVECLLRGCLSDEVQDFYSEARDGEALRKNRGTIIGALRHGLARVALEYVDPDLVILDEFQRFKDVLDYKKGSVIERLFEKRAPTLILSATPYKMFTLDFEDEDHYDDLCATIGFLRNEPKDAPGIKHIKKQFWQFGQEMEKGRFLEGENKDLLRLKRGIENQLKQVMCRTERNWYIEAKNKGVRESPESLHSNSFPHQEELEEFVRLRRFLRDEEGNFGGTLDYWKSGPSILSFMDSSYVLMRHVKSRKRRAPKELFSPENTGHLPTRNLKMRMLGAEVFGSGGVTVTPAGNVEGNRGDWRFLWIRPTNNYYQDQFFGDQDPKKFLVFSHWRFVPKAISICLSEMAESLAGVKSGVSFSSPLSFKPKIGYYPFDVSYPSWALAEAVSITAISSRFRKLPTKEEVFAAGREIVRKLLLEAKIGIGETKNAPLWQIVARLEAKCGVGSELQAAFEYIEVGDEPGGSRSFATHRDNFWYWMEDDEQPLTISEAWLDRLTHIALYSPAISLLRATRTIFPDAGVEELMPGMFALCLNEVRNFFNKSFVQSIIGRHGRGGRYTERVLQYCRDAHIQAVMDEFVYLAVRVMQKVEIGDFVECVARVMGMGRGSPQMNVVGRWGRIESIIKAGHFALAFGEDVSVESEKTESEASRKTSVREAFNSPFWPFVLATTSVGQEGLDFHLYCQNVVHWNLPSNPVDLEQREGRIARRDGLCIRRNIAHDVPLRKLREFRSGERGNVWDWLFEAVERHPRDTQQYKHGLYPHWIYESSNHDAQMINRYLLFYDNSRDLRKYKRLKEALSLYRLAFGQPRQQDLLDRICEKLGEPISAEQREELLRALPAYMVNLSPFPEGYALKSAEDEARRLLGDEGARKRLIMDVAKLMKQNPRELGGVSREVDELVEIVKNCGQDAASKSTTRVKEALTALIYLRNPYDDDYDMLGGMGWVSDIALIRKIFAKLQACHVPGNRTPRGPT